MSWEEYKSKLPKIYSEKDLAFIEKAFSLASKIHQEEKRLTGEPYITHPIAVSLKVANLKLGPQTIAAALLHDAPEQNGNKIFRLIRKEFGQETSFLIKGLTKADKVRYRGVERTAESIRRMFIAMAQDLRVVIIKLFDRLHNLQTLYVFPKEKQKRLALETLEIYAPVADRLGMGDIKSQLEDAAFKYAYPEEYKWITEKTSEKIPEREAYLKCVIPVLKKELDKANIKTSAINFRAKHYYSLWKKLLRNDMDWNVIYDLAAARIIVNSVEDCYSALGVIHKLWKPLPGRIKDYIALPKQNGYQSLHTTVFCVNNKITEFQIRTKKMHEKAEYGIAAHWAWEMAGKSKEPKYAAYKKFRWVKQLKEWHENFNKNLTGERFLKNLKLDFFKDRVFVLTPKGDVIDLPEGATPVDFAYHIHSEIGDTMTAAKINNHIVPLSYELASGDMVEILTQKNKKPSIKWLELAKTSLAKDHIKNALKKEGVRVVTPPNQWQARMTLIVKDRIGLMKDVSSAFSSFKINLKNIHTEEIDKENISILLEFSPKNKDQLERLTTRLKKISGVEEIKTKIAK
jgi:GTP pyrophosphokinase